MSLARPDPPSARRPGPASEDEEQDTMALTFSIPQDQLDLNRNGVFDAATESIAMTSETVPDLLVILQQAMISLHLQMPTA